MSENSVIVPIEEEDLLGAENSDDDVGENGEKVLSEFEEFAHCWRSSVCVANAFFQYLQYEYLNDLLSKQNLTTLAVNDWDKYFEDWYKVHLFINYLLDKLEIIQTNNVFEEEQKNKDINYLSNLRDLLLDFLLEKRNILTPLLPVPELHFQETATLIKKKGESKYKRIFHNLLHLYIFVYKEELSSDTLLKKLQILFENISSRRQQFDEFIRNFVINQECSEEVLQRWEELQQFLTSYFNNNSKETQQNEPKSTKVAEQSSQFFLFLQSLLKKDELKWTKEIDQLLKDHQFELHIHNYYGNFIKNNVKQLFLIILLDIKFDLRNFVKAHEATIQKTLNDNFLKQWRRVLHVPVTLLQFQQYRIYCCNLNIDQSEEWAIETEKAIYLFKDIIRKNINYVMNISIRLEILKNTSIILESDQLIEDSEYLNNLLQILTEIASDERKFVIPLPPVPNSNLIVASHSPISETESALSDVVFHLYYFYKLINKIPKTEFCKWNKELFRYISKDINSLDNFIYNYCKNQHDERDVLSIWEEFKIFLSENKNIENNLLETGGDEPNRFIELYRLIFDKNRQRERELQSASPIDFGETDIYDKMHEMQIYIILLLDVIFNIRIFIKNTTNLNFSLAIIFQFLLIYFKYNKIHSIILHSYFNVNPIFHIVEVMQILITTCDKEDFLFYNDLNQFRNILENKNKYNSIEILEKIENMHLVISNLNNDENNTKKQNIILYNLYCFWRIFIKKKADLNENFFQWNQKMFYLFFLKLNEIDSIINKLLTEDDKTTEMWRCFKKFIIRKYAKQEENDSNEIHHNVNFELFLNKNLSFPEGMEDALNFHLDPLDISLNEYEVLYIFILLDSPFPLKQMANFVCEYNMSLTYNDLNFCKFIYFTLLNNLNKNKINKLSYSEFSRYNSLIKNLNEYSYAYKTLNEDHLNIMDCLKQIEKNEITNNFFHLNKIPQLPIDIFQLQMNNGLFLIQYHQIFYLHVYFKIARITELKEKRVVEKIQSILKYIYSNHEKMNDFINSYFGNSENTKVFQSNWNLIKETITNLSLKDFNNSWQLLLTDFEKYLYEEYFEVYELDDFRLIIEMNEIDAAQHILLILLNVPMSEISESQYKETLTLDDLFSFMIQYRKLMPNLSYENQHNILVQYDLTMDEFLIKLENVSNAPEGEDESSKLLVKSEFNRLEKQEKTAIIENLIDIVQSQNTHGYLIIIFKILISLLPLIDIFLDIILAIQFFFSNEMTYFGLTIGILLITGIATVAAERILKSEIQWKPTYYVGILNYDKLKYLLSFTQITLFLRALNEALLRLEIKKKKNNSFLTFINYGDPEFLKKETQTLKYVEMCFEAIPQTILQLYIILTSKEWGVFQIVSIFTSICNINVSVWTYLSTRDPKKEMEVLENKRLILREFCFYGARIISTSLMSSLFSWMFLTSWIGFHITMDLLLTLIKRYKFFQNWFKISSIHNFKFMKAMHTDFPETKKSKWNYISLVEFLIFTAICSVYVLMYLKEVDDHLIFVNLFFIYICLFITWAGLSMMFEFENDGRKISTKARNKVLNYYEQILWGEVGNYLEHIILWWAPSPLAARPPHSSQHLREWINQFLPTAEDVPASVLSALSSLADGLGVHVNFTSWDQNFRLAIVASKTTCNPETGKLFCHLFQDLVMLSNQCEVTPDWIIGAPLDELPLVEQIPVLHRLDHSIHTFRLWAVNESKKIANAWNLDAFFAVTHNDIVNCINQLNNLRFNDHSLQIEKGGLAEHVQVCAMMRAKLVSEVNVNIQKLKDAPSECVTGLASVCRTISLANLQMIFPLNSYWRQTGNTVPNSASAYVNKFLDQILKPVLAATTDHIICNMILTLICESWLDHIYINKIKFSQYGAVQLLCDFDHINTWLDNCSIISGSTRKALITNEILRRCEGVGRLLLRNPGEKIKMTDKSKRKVSVTDNSDQQNGDKAELMPAEMYVPNQEQWLALRAIKKRNLMFNSKLCCGQL